MVRSRASLEEDYRKATPKSLAQWERGKATMPGGLIKGAYWTAPHPIYVDRAEDCYVWDVDGRRYVDFDNHHTAMILGHSHPAVVEAVREEVERGFGLGGPTMLEAEIAEEITRRIPSVEKVRFTNSGTESTLHATRLVRQVTGKPKIAKFEGAYHGSHDAVEVSVGPPLDKAGPADAPVAVPAWEGMADGSADNVVVLPYSQPETVELILREHQDEIAAVFFDGKPGVLDVSADFARFVRDTTEELGILMIMDEVVSFRAGYGGYQGVCGIKPDLSIFGKIVGGGLPVGALGGRADLMDVLDNTQGPTSLNQSGTFSGNNFTLAAGLATLQALTPEVYAHLGKLRDRLESELLEVYGRAGVACQVVAEGSLVHTYLTDQPVRDHRSTLSADADLFDRINLAMVLKGYRARGGMGLVLSSPMQDEHIDGLLESLDEALAEVD